MCIRDRHLERTGLSGYFQEIVSGDMVEKSKPEPDIYLKACEVVGVLPENAMGIEDSFNGIRAVAAAGMTAVMVPDMVQPVSYTHLAEGAEAEKRTGITRKAGAADDRSDS